MSETRALSAALSGPAFYGAASRSALHSSERHVDRWAPEGAASRRDGGMRSLAFADRVASPWMSGAGQSRMTQMFAQYAGGTQGERSVPGVSWLFPRPWFQDELDWMAAAREGLEATPSSALSTRGTYIQTGAQRPTAASGVAPTAAQAWTQVAMPVLSPDVMAAVAPSMRASRRNEGAAPMQQQLRAWSPTVDFAAAAAAEVVMGAMSSVEAAGLPALAERSPIWSGLAVVTPAALAESAPEARASEAPRGTEAALASIAASRAAMAAAQPSAMATTVGVAPTSVESQHRVEHARESLARIESRVEALRQPAASPAAASSESGASPSVTAAPAPVLSTGEQQLATAARDSSAVSRALRTVELLLGAAAPGRAVTTDAAARTDAPTADGEVAAPSSAFAPAPASQFAPSAGPRVAMPVGLGGLVASIEASRTVARPLSRVQLEDAPAPIGLAAMSTPMTASMGAAPEAAAPAPRASTFAPVWAQSPTALASVAGQGARAVDHLSWSDRWLARFAGASPLALSAFDSARAPSELATRPLFAGSPEIVYVQPALTPRSIADVGFATRAQPLPEPGARPAMARPTGALRIDDNESVPDDVFAAIAAASVAPRAPAARAPRAPSMPVVSTDAPEAAPRAAEATASSPVVAPVDLLRATGRASVADLVSVAVPAAPDAGMAAGLASSPIAPALAGVLPLPQAPVFDPRALSGAGLSEAYLGGLLARAALPVGVLAAAPSASSLAAAGSFGGTFAAAPSLEHLAMATWSRRDLSLAPLSMRLAAAAPDREVIATGGDVDVVLRGRASASMPAPAAAAPGATYQSFPGALPVVAPAGSPAERAAIERAAAEGARPTTAPAPRTAAADAIGSFDADAVRADEIHAEPRTDGARTDAARADAPAAFAPDAIEAALPASERAALETELVALRSALLATPSSTTIPLGHAEHAPLVASSTAIPDRARTSLPSLAGVVAGAPSPMGTLLAHGAMETLDGTPTSATPFEVPAPLAPLHAPTVASAGGRPGGLAEAALAWSIGEERAAANLAFDFVTPELLLAAKVYGLPPGAAAEALRIASAGPSAMSSLATSLDLTFLRAFQSAPQQAAAGFGPGAAPGAAPTSAAAARAELGPFVTTTGPRPETREAIARAETREARELIVREAVERGEVPAAAAASIVAAFETAAIEPAATAAPATAPAAAEPSMFGAPPAFAAPTSAPRLPRGAFLWPPGAVAAMGLRALSPEGHAGLPVVALELLAAQAVAELGTFVTAFPPSSPFTTAGGAAAIAGMDDATAIARGFSPAYVAAARAAMPGATAAAASVVDRGGPLAAPDAGAPDASSPDAATDEAAAWSASLGASIPTARARFESVYIALAQSPEGQTLSPSARAARAMSLLARSDDSGRLTTRERAQAAWSMLPGVYGGDLEVVAPRGLTPAGDDGAPGQVLVDTRPGLAGLAARAGDALGSFVSPSVEEISAVGSRGDASVNSAANRVAPPVYVDSGIRDATASTSPSITAPRAGRTYSQFGGGETEIPSWFESAARKLFDGGTPTSAAMNLAQMVLVTAMPQKQIAAAGRGANAGGAGQSPTGAGAKQQAAEKPDVDQLALEIFHEVMKLIEIARERSGDPFQ